MYGSLFNSLDYIFDNAIASFIMALVGDLFGIEVVLVLAAYWAARTWTNFGEEFFARAENFLSKLARRKVVTPLVLITLVILVRLAFLPVLPVPHPNGPDEFSHLLLADTLAHGRLTNAPHSMWRSFETIHEIQQPTYNSMYFPGPALLLWIGQVLTGVPWAGVLCGTAALCGVVYWALLAWFPSRWALLGGSLAAAHIGLLSYWMNSYWGGTFAALGSTLLLGSFARLEKARSYGFRAAGWAVLMALGIGMLANSRPYEGLAFCIPVAVRLCGWLFEKRGLPFAPKIWCVIAPMAACLVLIGVCMGIYFQAVTGSPTRLPYVVNQQQYGWPMTLPWQDVNWVQHDRPEFAEYYLYELTEHIRTDTFSQLLAWNFTRLQADWRFFVGPALMIPCLFFRRICLSRRLRLPLTCAGVVLVASYMTPHFPHYIAPILLPVVAVWVQGFRYLRQAKRENPRPVAQAAAPVERTSRSVFAAPATVGHLGVRLSRAIPVVLVAVITLRLSAGVLHLPDQKITGYMSWCCTSHGHVDQQAVVRMLPSGRHLLLVRYRADHLCVEQWVYNGADIDGSPVVWARELGGEQDRKLVDYFKDRQVWIVEADAIPPRVTPYRTENRRELSTKTVTVPTPAAANVSAQDGRRQSENHN